MVIFYMKKHLIILLAFSFIFFYCENSKKKTEQKAKGLILFTVGEIQRENQNLQANSVIEEKERIQTGNKSICDIQLLDLSTKIVARVKENTTFTLEKSIVSGKTTYQLKQQNGTVLFSINSKSPDENYQFMAPVSVVSVRGTKFAIETLEGKSSKLSVIEGKLAYRMRIPQIEDLPSPVIHSNQPLYKTIDFLESHEISLNQGEFIEIEYD
ncbi:MAG: FecR domain-containing protein, partial [Leptospiraceae bacterium]|nr:FecR domain-containing protein [Leptospiraceae bacterium]